MVALWFAAIGMIPILGVLLFLNPGHTWDTYAQLLVLPLLTAAGVEVGDPPETVLSTYARVLAEAGWIAQRSFVADTPALTFRAGSNTRISSTYTLQVDVKQIASDRTRITLRLKQSMGL